MRITNLAALMLFAISTAGADGGCFGDSDPDGPPPPVDGGMSPGLAVTADAELPGPFAPGETVRLNASAEGGTPPYTFVWNPPARTLDPDLGIGEVVAASSSFSVLVAVTDAKGARAQAGVRVEVREEAAVLVVGIEGPGSVRVGRDNRCLSTCRLDVAPGAEITLVADPADDARFAGWAGCSESTSRAIVVPVPGGETSCTAHFEVGHTMIPCDAMPPPPVAAVTVRPAPGDPPFATNGAGFFVVPPSTRITIDGGASMAQNGDQLTFRWSVTWDPLHEVPNASTPFFRIRTPGFSGERVDAVLEVEDTCGQTATATATYVTS